MRSRKSGQILLIVVLALSAARFSASVTFTVTNTNDSGPGSLRQAMLGANANSGLDTIAFAIGSGIQTIAPLSALPTITDPVIIDGTTQPGFSGTPVIELTGINAGTGATGLYITAGNSTVRGLVINQFDGQGVFIYGGYGGGANVIVGNYIGTDVSGKVAKGNGNPTAGGDGISIDYGSNNVIGGESAASRNLISGNISAGVLVANSFGNHILGNYIGTDVTGTVALGNTIQGILLVNSTNTTIGGTTAGARNIISGNGDGSNAGYTRAANVDIFGGGNNTVEGNYIGTSADGTASLGDQSSIGVVASSSGDVIGGSVLGARNVISGNGLAGIMSGPNWIAGNYIGPNAAGTATPTG